MSFLWTMLGQSSCLSVAVPEEAPTASSSSSARRPQLGLLLLGLFIAIELVSDQTTTRACVSLVRGAGQ